MKVQMKTPYCSPNGFARTDSVIDVPDAEGQQLIAGGFAVPCTNPAARVTLVVKGKGAVEVETASLAGGTEAASLGGGRSKRGG